ncbi:MAG TPA: ABC transporter permease [Steroidobacteraceae bacterium]
MQTGPILAALGRHKIATALIVLQIALTLAVASNALFVVVTRLVHLSRPTGTDESHLFVIKNNWKNGQDPSQIDAQIRTDLVALRKVPRVRDAFSSEAFPLEAGYGLLTGLKLKADQTARPKLAVIYFADEHAIDTLGVSLTAGRNFRANEVAIIGRYGKVSAPVVIITNSLARKLFAGGAALGKTVYLPGGPALIIGVLQSLQGPYAGSGATTRPFDEDNVLFPARSVDPEGLIYLVRTTSTDAAPIIKAALEALSREGNGRLIDPTDGVLTLTQARARGYATDRSVALMLSIVSGLLLLATAGGIVGLSSFWVSQRRRQIGIRRSLGASAGDILGYFQVENFLIVTGGIAIGSVLAMLANLGLMKFYALARLPVSALLIGALLLWLLGQMAAYGPARAAARLPPVAAIRSG